jgi:hypothetical protein
MSKKLRSRLTYSNVMVTILAFLVLGGGAAFAATKLAKNSVGTKQLKNNAVTTKKIKNGAVTGAKVNVSSLGTVPSATNAANANTLGGIGSTAFSRQAHSAIDDNALVGETGVEQGTAREVSITAPQNGFLLAIASSDTFLDGPESDSFTCLLNVDGSNLSQSRRTSEVSEVSSEENCGTNAIVPVAAGPHNVKFNFTSVGEDLVVDETELDVVFIPLAG